MEILTLFSKLCTQNYANTIFGNLAEFRSIQIKRPMWDKLFFHMSHVLQIQHNPIKISFTFCPNSNILLWSPIIDYTSLVDYYLSQLPFQKE